MQVVVIEYRKENVQHLSLVKRFFGTLFIYIFNKMYFILLQV